MTKRYTQVYQRKDNLGSRRVTERGPLRGGGYAIQWPLRYQSEVSRPSRAFTLKVVYNYTMPNCVFPSLAPLRTYAAPRPRKTGILHSESPLAFRDMTMIPHFATVNYLPRMNLESPCATVRGTTLGGGFSTKMRARRARRGSGSTELHTLTILATSFAVDSYSPGPAAPRARFGTFLLGAAFNCLQNHIFFLGPRALPLGYTE